MISRFVKRTFQKRFYSLQVTPAVSLLDEEVTIEASNLAPGKKVTLETHLINEKERFNFHSTCHYLPQQSSFSTSSDAPLADSCYTGVHGSGPLWSVSRSPGHKPRLWPGDIRSSLQYNIVLRDSETEPAGRFCHRPEVERELCDC